MKEGTVALVIRFDKDAPVLVEYFSDEAEIVVVEDALKAGEDPILKVQEYRAREAEEDEEFGDYVEDLLSKPFLRPEIQLHGLQWMKSKIRIETFKQTEAQAAKVIAEYAINIFKQDQDKTDFILVGPTAKVRIRVFSVQSVKAGSSSGSEVA